MRGETWRGMEGGDMGNAGGRKTRKENEHILIYFFKMKSDFKRIQFVFMP